MRPRANAHPYFELFVVDNDPATHEALYRPLFFEGWRLISFYDGDTFLNAPTLCQADCILLDLDITDHHGAKVWDQLDAKSNPAPTLVTSKSNDLSLVVNSIRKGALDFVTKPINVELVIKSLRMADAHCRCHFPHCELLTPREYQVLKLITKGSFNREIGRELGVSYRTVEVHRAHIMKKLHARNTAELVRMALEPRFDSGATIQQPHL